MGTLGTKIGESINKYSGLSLADEGLSKFTNSAAFTGLANKLGSSSCSLSINNTKVPVKAETGKFTSAFNAASGTVDNTLGVVISSYTTPTRLALDAFSDIGKDIDKTLKKSFLLQTLNIKGTDILCAAFCFLISLLSCKERGDLYETLKFANKAAQSANVMTNSINNMVNTVGATMASVDAITDSAKNLFSGTSNKNDIQRSIHAASTIMAAPASIMNNAKLVANMLKLGAQYKFIMPNVAGKTIWDLSANVLYALQCMAVQAADEALSKVTNPIEEKIRSITPSPCFGTMAVRIQQAIIQKIREFKGWLISQIGELFTTHSDFSLNFELKVNTSALSLELRAFAIALDHITAHFFEIASNCGLSPCSGNAPTAAELGVNDIGNLESIINDDPFDRIKTLPQYVSSAYTPPPDITGTNLEALASKMAPSLVMSEDKPNVYVTSNEVLAVYTIDQNDIPKKISELVQKGALNSILDDSYTVYKGKADNNIKIVYRYDKKCGEK